MLENTAVSISNSLENTRDIAVTSKLQLQNLPCDKSNRRARIQAGMYISGSCIRTTTSANYSNNRVSSYQGINSLIAGKYFPVGNTVGPVSVFSVGKNGKRGGGE
jgi:hypothetical protein